MHAAIELGSIPWRFGETVAVEDLDLAIPQGGLYRSIGPNGAGKTTASRIIMSILFPDSALSVLLSFFPPVNTFAMLLRMASNVPPPLWQVWVSIAIGVASVLAAVWFSAKVFRIGLLMHGKPPNFATLIRRARAA